MPDEIITATTLEEAQKELRDIYRNKNHSLEEIDKETYDKFDHDERPDSDNHLNDERLESGNATVIDHAFYKYLPDRRIAYRIVLKHKNGEVLDDYFLVTPEFS